MSSGAGAIGEEALREALTKEPALQPLFDVIDEAWRAHEADDRDPTFDDLTHDLLDALGRSTLAPEGFKRLLAAVYPTASDDERDKATGIALKAHAKSKHHCVCCEHYDQEGV